MASPNKIWVKEVNDGIITEEVLSAALYSVNKRAKNYRDTKRKYSRTWNYTATTKVNIKNCEAQIEKYYHMKDVMLTVLTPVKVHEQELNNGEIETLLVYRTAYGCYHKPVGAEDIPNIRFKTTRTGGVGKFTPAVKRVRLSTKGCDPKDTVSAQFATKVYELVCSGQYTYIPQRNRPVV